MTKFYSVRVDPIFKNYIIHGAKGKSPKLSPFGKHGGESCDILHLYSDRTGKNIRHNFLNTQWIFIR